MQLRWLLLRLVKRRVPDSRQGSAHIARMAYTAEPTRINSTSVRSARSKDMASQTAGSRTRVQAKGAKTGVPSFPGCAVAVALVVAAVAVDALAVASHIIRAAAAVTVLTGRALGDYLREWTMR